MENNTSYQVEIIAREYQQEPGLEKECVGEKIIRTVVITAEAYKKARANFDTAEEAVLSLLTKIF